LAKLVFALEPVETSWKEMIELASQHWCETEGYRHNQPFAPSYERYKQYADIGCFFQFTARDEGRMIGYSGIYIVPSMHTQMTIATEDTWFLLPEYRKGRNAIEFYKFVEAECRSRGVVEIGMTAKLTNSAGRVLEYLGYEFTSKQYSKHLTSVNAQGDNFNQSVRADSAPLNVAGEVCNVRSESARRTDS
jgi:hypothetical protein